MRHKKEMASEASNREKRKLNYLERVKQEKKDEAEKWRAWIGEEELKMWHNWKIMQSLAYNQGAYPATELEPCMGGKTFLSRNSATLSQLTVWSPQKWADNRTDFPGIHRFPKLTPAYWPQISELRAAAAARSTAGHGATLPAPKSRNFDWNLGTPMPFFKEPGRVPVAWSGVRGVEVPWNERARVCLPELDCVMESGFGVEQNLEQLETEWVGRALWEAIEEE
jgi:hypothetical protein